MIERHNTTPPTGVAQSETLHTALPVEAVAATETLSGNEQIDGLLQAIESQIHYPAAIQQLVAELPSEESTEAGPLWQTFSYINLVRATIDAGHTFTGEETSTTASHLLELVTTLEAENLLAGEIAPGYSPEARERIITLCGEYGEVTAAITPIVAIAASYSRLDYNELQGVVDALKAVANLQSLASRNPLNGQPLPLETGLGQNPNTAFLDAMLQYTRRAMNQLPAEYRTLDPGAAHVRAFIEASQELDAPAIIEKITLISETGSLPFGMTEQGLKEFIAGSVPPPAIEPVTTIEFRAFRPDELESQDPRIIRQGQVVVVDGIRRKIIISPDAIQTSLEGDPSKERLQLEIKRILTHEFGHVLHTILPLPLLRQWLDTIQDSVGNITRYVREVRHTKPQRLNGEEFCDAMDLLVGQPERLMIISPTHLKGMDRIYQQCMPGYKKGLRQTIMSRIETKLALYKAKGISEDTLRQIYLKHELEPPPQPMPRQQKT